jgi:hypothetical protein
MDVQNRKSRETKLDANVWPRLRGFGNVGIAEARHALGTHVLTRESGSRG